VAFSWLRFGFWEIGGTRLSESQTGLSEGHERKLLMPTFNLDPIVKALVVVILFSVSIGKFSKLRDFAIREGVRAITMKDYRPTYFAFPRRSP
jgi:hypothetical protein